MNKIEKMIDKMCPQGVEFKALGEVCDETNNIRWQDNIKKTFQYIDLTSVDRETRTIADTKTINSGDAPSRAQKIIRQGDILFGTTRPTLKRYCLINNVFDKQICSTGFCVIRPRTEEVLTNFIFHMIGTSTFYNYVEAMQKGASYPAISDAVVKKIKIPIPPLAIQKEIVKILDNFTDLEAELKAELKARKKQYEYYREELLTFGDDVEFKALADLFEIKNGYTPSKSNPEYWTNGTIPWFRMEDIRKNGRILKDSIQHIAPEAVKNGKLFPANSIIIATTATIGEHALITVDSLANQQFTFLSKKMNCSEEIDMKFFFYYCYVLGEWCNNNTNSASFSSVIMTKFKKLKIPIPPLSEQKRIVSILDKFDALVSDISIGLPAEISARRKQYEYYRNQLLSFEPVVND